MRGISKSFPGVQALQEVDFFVSPGEAHALMGENGAGKSTLIKVLTGIHRKDSGQILLGAELISPASAAQAQHAGISTIYQELNLVPFLGVGENIFIGREPRKNGLIDWKTVEQRARELLREMGLDQVDVKEPFFRQSVAVQQMVAIARAVSIEARLLVMDEPTSSLSEKEVKVLFDVIRRLKKQDMSVIFISHKLDEVFEICDKATILRDGRLVGEYPMQELTRLKMISLMIGRDAESVLEKKRSVTGGLDDRQAVLEATGLSRGQRTREISIDIRTGEILGVAGLLGSGRTELARILFGDDRQEAGQIKVKNETVEMNSPGDAIRIGFGFCSEDRKEEGIFPNMSVTDNMTMAILPKLSRAGVLSRKAQREMAETYIRKLRIATSDPNQQIKELSGGNQQKVLLARWLCKNPILMILDEPTRGIDVGGKSEIESMIAELAENGVAILMISSELEELVRSCDRIAVLSEGRKIGELKAEEISEESIVHMMALGHKGQGNAYAG
ncbi:MAG: sugar ABC transporter ATP-binding protein [Planctomycetota bacterium]|nr:sugar ABC transporter ATP-binding protein [Planctomycetota bacterium]